MVKLFLLFFQMRKKIVRFKKKRKNRVKRILYKLAFNLIFLFFLIVTTNKNTNTTRASLSCFYNISLLLLLFTSSSSSLIAIIESLHWNLTTTTTSTKKHQLHNLYPYFSQMLCLKRKTSEFSFHASILFRIPSSIKQLKRFAIRKVDNSATYSHTHNNIHNPVLNAIRIAVILTKQL